MEIKRFKTKNFNKGRSGQKVTAICLHIMEGSLKGTDFWFADSNSGVSAHYGIGKNGEIHQYVDEKDTSWAAGRVNKPSWRNIPAINPNLVLINIEHEGYSRDVWTEKMKKASAKLVADICKRWGFSPNYDTVIGHYMVDSIRRPNCPAQNKNIINEIIELARKEMV